MWPNLGLSYGGYLPKGRKAEDGPLDQVKYRGMTELGSTSYRARTERNVKELDATIIFTHGALEGGSLKTREFAGKHGKPYFHVDFEDHPEALLPKIRDFIASSFIWKINIAGPRASKYPLIYEKTRGFLTALLRG